MVETLTASDGTVWDVRPDLAGYGWWATPEGACGCLECRESVHAWRRKDLPALIEEKLDE